MMNFNINFQDFKKNLSAASCRDSYELHILALELGLSDSILIQSEDDIKAVNWKDAGLKPFHYQIANLISFCHFAPAAMIADEVGLGKTISAGVIASELMARRQVKRILIVAPKTILPQWQEELERRFQLKPVRVNSMNELHSPGETEIATGRQLITAMKNPDRRVVLTTYNSLATNNKTETQPIKLLEPGLFQMCILDEAHLLRTLRGPNHSSKRSLAFYHLFSQEIKSFKYVLMLTATPIQNYAWDLYSLIELLCAAKGQVNPLGDSEEAFQEQYLEDRYGLRIRPSQRENLRNVVRSLMLRTRRYDARVPFPKRKFFWADIDQEGIELPEDSPEKSIYNRLKEILKNSNIDGKQFLVEALMSSPLALATQIQNTKEKRYNFSWGASERELSDLLDELRRLYPVKLQKLNQIILSIEEYAKEKDYLRVIIFVRRIETLKMISEFLRHQGYSVGCISSKNDTRTNNQTIEGFGKTRWEKPKFNIIVSTDKGSVGLNLQAGNVVINYDMPWNPMILEQRIGRVQRLGSEYKNVYVCNLYVKGTVEEYIVNRIVEKLLCIQNSVGSIESVLGDIFEDEQDNSETKGNEGEKLGKLIGHYATAEIFSPSDAEKYKRAIEESIQRAREIYQARQKELERLETSQADLSSVFHHPYKFERVPISRYNETYDHSLTLPEYFVLRACQYGRRTDTQDGHWRQEEWQTSGKHTKLFYFTPYDIEANSYKITLNQEHQDLPPSEFYAPGSPNYDGLVQYWSRKFSESFYNLEIDTSDIELMVSQWWETTYPGTKIVEIAEIEKEKIPHYRGCALIKTAVQNGIDKMEKLIPVPFASESEFEELPELEDFEVSESKTQNEEDIQRVITDLEKSDLIQESLQNDRDVQGFCDYYSERLKEDLKVENTGNDPYLINKIKEDLVPSGSAECGGISGQLFWSYRIRINYQIHYQDQTWDHSANIRLLPVAHRFIEFPEPRQCSISGITAPEEELQECPQTDEWVLKKLMVTLEDGQKVSPKAAVTCDVCGKLVLKKKTVFGEEKCGCKEHFVKTKKPGGYLLRENAFYRKADDKWYGKEFGKQSDCSGEYGLFPEDLTVCSLTEQNVLISETVECCISHKPILRDKAAQSFISKRYFNPNLGETTEDGKLLPPDEVCPLCRKAILPDQEKIQWKNDSKRYCHQSHFVLTEKPGGYLLREEAFYRKANDKWYGKEFGKQSDCSGEYGLFPEDLTVCSLTEQNVLISETVECCISHKPILRDKAAQSFISKRYFNPKLGETTEDGKLLPPDEVCPICRKAILPDQETIDDEKSQRKTHLSHYGECQISHQLHPLTELIKTDAEGLTVHQNFVRHSELSGRSGLSESFLECAETHRQILKDEAVQSRNAQSQNDLWYAKDLLRPSAVSGKLGLPCDMVRWELLEEPTDSAPQESEWIFPEEQIQALVDYSGTQRWVRMDKVTKSPLSGRYFWAKGAGEKTVDGEILPFDEVCAHCRQAIRPNENFIESPEHPKRYAHKFHYVFSEKAERYILIEDAFIRTQDNEIYPKSWGEKSEYSGIYGLPEDFIECSLTQKRVLISETVECCISHKPILRDEASASRISQRFFNPLLGVRTRSGELLPPDEVCPYCQNAITMESRENGFSVVFQEKNYHRSHFVETRSGDLIIRCDAALSDYSHRWGRKEELTVSKMTGRRGFGDETAVCCKTGERRLLDELCFVQRDQKYYTKILCVESKFQKGYWGLRGDLVFSDTGKRVFPEELHTCEFTGKRVCPNELVPSIISGKQGWKDVMIRAVVQDENKRDQEGWAYSGEVSQCEWRHWYVPKEEMGVCSLTGLKVRQKYLDDKGRLEPLGMVRDKLEDYEKYYKEDWDSKWKNAPGILINLLLENDDFQRINHFQKKIPFQNLPEAKMQIFQGDESNAVFVFTYLVETKKGLRGIFFGPQREWIYTYGYLEITEQRVKIPNKNCIYFVKMKGEKSIW